MTWRKPDAWSTLISRHLAGYGWPTPLVGSYHVVADRSTQAAYRSTKL